MSVTAKQLLVDYQTLTVLPQMQKTPMISMESLMLVSTGSGLIETQLPYKEYW